MIPFLILVVPLGGAWPARLCVIGLLAAVTPQLIGQVFQVN